MALRTQLPAPLLPLRIDLVDVRAPQRRPPQRLDHRLVVDELAQQLRQHRRARLRALAVWGHRLPEHAVRRLHVRLQQARLRREHAPEVVRGERLLRAVLAREPAHDFRFKHAAYHERGGEDWGAGGAGYAREVDDGDGVYGLELGRVQVGDAEPGVAGVRVPFLEVAKTEIDRLRALILQAEADVGGELVDGWFERPDTMVGCG